MEVNRTLYEDVITEEFSSPSTSTFTAEDAFQTRDPLIDKIDVNNVTGNIDTSIEIPSDLKIFDKVVITVESLFHETTWVVYTVAGLVTVTVIIIVCFIVFWIVKHKKRIIQYNNGPILGSTHDDGFQWKKYCHCCVPKLEKDGKLPARQNSASNLDPYMRPPLLSVGRKHDERDSYINVFNRADVLDGSKKSEAVDEKTLAINIQSIRGVPHVHLQPEEYRNLPPLKTRCENDK